MKKFSINTKKTDIYQTKFSYHNRINLEMTNNNIPRKDANTRKQHTLK